MQSSEKRDDDGTFEVPHAAPVGTPTALDSQLIGPTIDVIAATAIRDRRGRVIDRWCGAKRGSSTQAILCAFGP